MAVFLKMMRMSEDNSAIVSEQISIILGPNWIILFRNRKEIYSRRFAKESEKIKESSENKVQIICFTDCWILLSTITILFRNTSMNL